MASKVTGQQTAVFVEDKREFDPNSGDVYTQIWRGSRAACMTKGAELVAAGWRVSRNKFSGPGYQLTATVGMATVDGGGSGSEVPVDRWRIVTQLAQFSIQSNPKLITAVGNEGELAVMVADADRLISESDSGSGLGGVDLQIYNLRARGVQAYETKRPVLTRIRGVSTAYPGQFVMEGQPKVYTTASLITTFAVPAAVVARLPSVPATAPTDSVWAWLWQQQDSDIIPTIGRVEEMDSWVFAAWSSVLYDVI